MSTLSLKWPPQNVPAIRAEVFDVQCSSQDLLCKPRLVQVQRARWSGVCCCHVNTKFCLLLQSLKRERFVLPLFDCNWMVATPHLTCIVHPRLHSTQMCQAQQQEPHACLQGQSRETSEFSYN